MCIRAIVHPIPTTTQLNPQTQPILEFNTKIPQNTQKKHNIGPPPQYLHVSPRPKHQKILISNSPKTILFAKQHRISRFPQNIVIHLATLFPVDLRELPFSEFSSKNPKIPEINSNPSN
jgi:hypothetical protein